MTALGSFSKSSDAMMVLKLESLQEIKQDPPDTVKANLTHTSMSQERSVMSSTKDERKRRDARMFDVVTCHREVGWP
jgi:hypothetical protein